MSLSRRSFSQLLGLSAFIPSVVPAEARQLSAMNADFGNLAVGRITGPLNHATLLPGSPVNFHLGEGIIRMNGEEYPLLPFQYELPLEGGSNDPVQRGFRFDE